MFVVCILAGLAAVCTASQNGAILLERDNNYDLPLNHGGLPSYEELLELYQRQLRKEQKIHLRQQSHHEGHQEHGPHLHPLNFQEPQRHRQIEHQKQHHDIYDHSHGHKILVSDHDTLIEFNRLKHLAKEAEHYFRPEFNGHKLRHHELIAYIEQLLNFGAEKDKLEHLKDDRRNAHLERHEHRNNKNQHDHEGFKPILVPEEVIKQKPTDVPDVESLLRTYEEHRPSFAYKEEQKYKQRLVHLEEPRHRIHEVEKAHINPHAGYFVPYRGRPMVQRESQLVQRESHLEQSPVLCINCGSHQQ